MGASTSNTMINTDDPDVRIVTVCSNGNPCIKTIQTYDLVDDVWVLRT